MSKLLSLLICACAASALALSVLVAGAAEHPQWQWRPPSNQVMPPRAPRGLGLPNPLFVERTSGSDSVGDIDKRVFDVLKASEIPGASLAIVNGTRLVYAKGYTWGPRNLPLITPTTYFRQASVSKLVASLAIMQLIQERKLALKDFAQTYLQATTGNGSPNDHNWDITTIEELLNMNLCSQDLFGFDPEIASALNKRLPLSRDDILTYVARQHDSSCHPSQKSSAWYNNTDYAVLGYVIAKIRRAGSMIDAIREPLLKPFAITRLRDARPLKQDQLPDEAIYFPGSLNPTAQSVMSAAQPQVEVGYGEDNFANFEGSGGLSAAATDIARLIAALSLTSDPNYDGKTISHWPKIVQALMHHSYQSAQDLGYTHKDANGNSDAFGFYGLDSVSTISPPGTTPGYSGDKGGYLPSSQNAIFFQMGGIGYVICWSGHTSNQDWYPVFKSVLETASNHNWGNTDLFPQYQMPPLAWAYRVTGPAVFHAPANFAAHDMRLLHPGGRRATPKPKSR